MKKRYSKQQLFKLVAKKCRFCPEDKYELLDVHRIVAGADGGKYHEWNAVTCCSNCHRKCHCGEIKIDRYYNSTKGRILHYWRDGQEFWE
jgi:hypothetical protein